MITMKIKANSKAQAAMEFLMTYGWAILVVLVAIGALAYFGVLSPDQFLPEKCVISIGTGLFCDDFSTSTSGVTIKLKNILGEKVTISDLTISNCGSYTTSTEIASDSSENIAVSCALISSTKFKEDISIIFSKGDDGFNKTATGSIVTVVP